MGRFLLLIIAGVVVSGLVLFGSDPDRWATESHARAQNRALVRETAEDALATVLEDAIDPATRGWRPALGVGPVLRVGGGVATVSYRLEDDDQVAVVGLRVVQGGTEYTTEGRYRIATPDWPSPLWVAAPYAVATVDPRATIDATDRDHGARPVYFDAARFEEYRLGSVLRLGDLQQDLGRPLADAKGDSPRLEIVPSMADVLAGHGTPDLSDLLGKALAAFEDGRDVRFAGGHVASGKEKYGEGGRKSDDRIVVVEGPLTVPDKAKFSGKGILIVRGDLVVRGKLDWDGLVLVTDPAGPTVSQKRLVDFEDGDVTIKGAMMVDQQAPPPGGHTDLTVNRSVSGVWGQPAGEAVGGKPWLQHTHRIDFVIPEVRTFYFAERGRDRHEAYTRLRQTLAAVATKDPGAKVYVRFKNHRNHGAALFTLRADGEIYQGSVGAGFGPRSRPGDGWASPAFAPDALNDLIVDVRSLRLLAHLVNGERPTSPAWTGGTCPDRPVCVGGLADRDGALAVQVVRDRDDAVLYEGSVYWHTKEDGHAESRQEADADAAWRAAIRAGTAPYGAEIRFGPKVKLKYDVQETVGISRRLGFGDLMVTHERTFVEHRDIAPVHAD